MPSSRNLRHLNLNLNCFSNSTSPESKSPPTSPIATSATSSRHHIHHKPPCASPSIMIKNFNSLYDHTLTFDHSLCSSSLSTTTTTLTTSTSFELELEPEPEPEPADFAAAFASKRFFFSSPGRSNSLIEYTNANTECTRHSSSVSLMDNPNGESTEKKEEEEEEILFNGSVAVPTYSPDPYMDFRRSMQEMVEARPELMDVRSNWNILHELLVCYLALNPKSTHKFILGAFADLLVSLLS